MQGSKGEAQPMCWRRERNWDPTFPCRFSNAFAPVRFRVLLAPPNLRQLSGRSGHVPLANPDRFRRFPRARHMA